MSDKPMNTLDWDKLKQFVQDRQPTSVDAGILNDWFWTADTVYQDGQFRTEHHAYTHSYWATPGFKATMPNGDVVEVAAYREQTKEEAEQVEREHQKLKADLREMAQTITQRN